MNTPTPHELRAHVLMALANSTVINGTAAMSEVAKLVEDIIRPLLPLVNVAESTSPREHCEVVTATGSRKCFTCKSSWPCYAELDRRMVERRRALMWSEGS